MRKVPDLWLQCLLQHQQISAVIPDSDTDLLSYLEEVSAVYSKGFNKGTHSEHKQHPALRLQIDVEDSSDIKSGYKITFTFKDNPFFQNHQLVKELLYSEDNALEVKCTDIDWTAEGVSCSSQLQIENLNNYLFTHIKVCVHSL